MENWAGVHLLTITQPTHWLGILPSLPFQLREVLSCLCWLIKQFREEMKNIDLSTHSQESGTLLQLYTAQMNCLRDLKDNIWGRTQAFGKGNKEVIYDSSSLI